MEVQEAVAVAKQYVAKLFAPEEATSFGLEEVEFDPVHNEWLVTVGFYRPEPGRSLKYPPELQNMASFFPEFSRVFKRVRLDDLTQKILAVSNRE